MLKRLLSSAWRVAALPAVGLTLLSIDAAARLIGVPTLTGVTIDL